VATGLVVLQIPRKVFYEKELNLVVSRGWGPGMYDADYAERGMKYPPTYARWTAQRNLAEFLALVAKGRVKPSVLTTHRFAFDQVLRAYELILSRKEPVLGVVLTYPELGQAREPVRVVRLSRQRTGPTREGDIGVGLIGAGLYARGTLMPALAKVRGVRLVGVATAGGLSGHHVGERFGFEYCTTDQAKLLEDEKVEAVFVLTRHNSHAELASEALRAGKPVFVEKPLDISGEQLEHLIATYNGLSQEGRRPFLMVGFNRRFSPAAAQAHRFVGASGDSAVVLIRCNAGPVPADSWVHHPEEGGGQIVGEVCHFVDLLQYLTGGRPQRVFAAAAPTPGHTCDALCISLQMDNGAAGSIVYAANGDKAFPRERVEVFAHGAVFVIDNFRSTETVIGGRRRRRRGWAVDRGHRAELEAFFAALRDGGEPPVPFESYVATTLATFAVETSISRGEAVTVPECLVIPEGGA
jgi:polar amino acid transport system substrate-binding protein